MTAAKMEWVVSGDCTEACTSPPVCPYYWGSSTPTDLHDGKNLWLIWAIESFIYKSLRFQKYLHLGGVFRGVLLACLGDHLRKGRF